jgi:Predicted ATPase
MSTKINRIKIQNFKLIKSFDKEVLGKDVFITGKNEVGKSSFIQAVWSVLDPKNLPPKPVTTGAKKGLIELELEGGYVARLK